MQQVYGFGRSSQQTMLKLPGGTGMWSFAFENCCQVKPIRPAATAAGSAVVVALQTVTIEQLIILESLTYTFC